FAWLFQIARNKLADHLRRRYRQAADPIEPRADCLAVDEPGPAAAAETEEARAEVRAPLGEPTPEHREVIISKYVLPFDTARPARRVGKNSNAVNQPHHRALASLRRRLGQPTRTR